MDQVKKSDIFPEQVSGKKLWDVFGADAYIKSTDASMAYCRVCWEDEAAEYNCCDQGVLYVVDGKGATLTYAEPSQTVEHCVDLAAGTVLRVQEGDRYRFGFSSPDGFVELVTFSPTPAAQLF